MAGVTPSFQFQVPPASEDTKAPGLLASMAPGGFMDAQKEMFLRQAIEKEDAVYQAQNGQRNLAEQLKDGLTPYQISLLEKVRRANTDPIVKHARKSERSAALQEHSEQMHKRVNPGYVEMPYESSNARDFKYVPPPDFTREYLKADSDCQFQKFAAEAILKHVDLNKTSH